MAYKSLYRTYRPQTFKDVAGQEAIITTLKHAIDEKKIAHAYLFCGPRGTGKTTVAKLLAKAVTVKGVQAIIRWKWYIQDQAQVGPVISRHRRPRISLL